MIARHLRVRASALALGVAASLMLGGCSMWGGTNQAKPLELGPMEPVLEVRQAWRAHHRLDQVIQPCRHHLRHRWVGQ